MRNALRACFPFAVADALALSVTACASPSNTTSTLPAQVGTGPPLGRMPSHSDGRLGSISMLPALPADSVGSDGVTR